ncbi:MAG: HD-GYP domain-containing protein [Candidatus Omnitrophota bacterium]
MSTKNYLILTKKYKTLLSALHSINRLTGATYDVKELVRRLTKLLSQIFKSSTCTVALISTSKNRHFVTLRCSFANNKRFFSTKKNPLKNKIEHRLVTTGSAIKKDRLIATPLFHEDVMGFIMITRNKKACRKENVYINYDLENLMTIAVQIVMAIRNIQLYAEQEKMVMGTIKSLIAVLDSKMPPAYTHTPNFLKLVKVLGEELNLNAQDQESLKYASLLHDAGKINVPTEILTKTSQLTGEEYDIIKRHPVKSAEIIKHLQILKPVMPIILYHHEKYDGTGYPSRLKAQKIPMGARVMAVADAFDAMVFGRPYKERIPVERALEEIKKHSGTQFDPHIVKALIKIFHGKKLKKYLQLMC